MNACQTAAFASPDLMWSPPTPFLVGITSFSPPYFPPSASLMESIISDSGNPATYWAARTEEVNRVICHTISPSTSYLNRLRVTCYFITAHSLFDPSSFEEDFTVILCRLLACDIHFEGLKRPSREMKRELRLLL